MEYIKIPVTVTAQVFLSKDDVEQAVADEPTSKYEDVISRMARLLVIEGDNFKIRDIFVDISNAK